MKRKYLPKTTAGKIARLAEEANEAAGACNKTLRVYAEQGGFIEAALAAGNPELPKDKRESNRDWILREVRDLKHAILQIEKVLS